MKRYLRRVLTTLGVLALLPAVSGAQEPTQVTGQVTAATTQQPMPGVQVVVKGTTIGTLTDGTGSYSLNVPAGSRTLVFSYIGYRTVEREITGGTVNASLEIQPIGLEGVVVTALGISREKRALGYSVQDVQGDRLAEVPELNVVNSLQGNVSGVKVTSTGPTGGSSRIVIRGANSISGNNQPLFVVDGVPIDNSAPTNDGWGTYGGGIDYGNAAGMIDPANIASVSVLKGANAAALYGSRAANGAIIITTKKGRGAGAQGLGITASQSLTFESPLRLPDFQDVYGQGSEGKFSFIDGTRYNAPFDGRDESWGPKMECQPVDQFFGEQQPFCPQPDNVRNFFELGRTMRTSVAFSKAMEDASVRLSVSNTDVKGIAPGNVMTNTSVALAGDIDITDRLSTEAAANYLRESGDRRPGTGYDAGNFMQQFNWFGRQVDVERLKSWQCVEGAYGCTPGEQFNWNYNFHENPYFIQFGNNNWDVTDRVIANAALSYRLTDWLTASLRSGTDWYREQRKRTYAMRAVNDPDGGFGENLIYRRETNTRLDLAATRQLTEVISFNVNAGGNVRDEHGSFEDVTVSVLNAPGIYNVANAGATPVINQTMRDKRVNSLYGAAELSYRDFFFLGLTGNNEWSSTLPENNNTYFYPSVSTSLIFTDAFGLNSDLLTYGKIRASWAQVGNDTDPYQLAATYELNTRWSGIPGYGIPNRLPNADLKPEQTASWETGLDLQFFGNRAGVSATYYDQSTRNQILPIQVSAASGYTNRMINAGEIRNRGVELMLNVTPVETGNFGWDVGVNWARNQSEVVELYGDLETHVLGTYDNWDGLSIEAKKGEPYGQIYGRAYVRVEEGPHKGRLLIGDNGLPVNDWETKKLLGNYNPDWTGGLSNQLRYKDFDLNVLVDFQKGGNVFSMTTWWGLYAGVLEETLLGREKGVDPDDADGDGLLCSPGIRLDGVVQTGEDASGNPIYEENTTRVCPEDYFHDVYNTHEPAIFDASYIKLREVALGFNVPGAWVNRLGFSGARVALIGRNLWLGSKAKHIDPETAFDASNVQGIEYGQFPTARSIGFTVSVQP